jgi:signal peptidase I
VGTRSIRVLICLGCAVFVLLLAFKLLGGIFSVPSNSMAPTLGVGSHVTVLGVGSPGVGDIVVAHPPVGAENGECGGGPPPAGQMCAKPTSKRSEVKFIKRVVAVGGDRIAMRDGRAIRNGRVETTTSLGECTGDEGCNYSREISVPDGHLFLLGDNRGSSDDSRFWGPVREDWVIGRLWFVINDG